MCINQLFVLRRASVLLKINILIYVCDTSSSIKLAKSGTHWPWYFLFNIFMIRNWVSEWRLWVLISCKLEEVETWHLLFRYFSLRISLENRQSKNLYKSTTRMVQKSTMMDGWEWMILLHDLSCFRYGFSITINSVLCKGTNKFLTI